MKSGTIEFDIKDAEEMKALAALIAGLNENNVGWTLKKDAFGIAITIGTGF